MYMLTTSRRTFFGVGLFSIPTVGYVLAASMQIAGQNVPSDLTHSSSNLVPPLISRITVSAPQPTAGWNFRSFLFGKDGFVTAAFPGSGAENVTLINTNVEGKTISTVELGPDEFFDFAFYKGAIWVLSGPTQGGVRLRRVDLSGGETYYQPPDKGLFRLGVTGAGLYGLTRAGRVIPLGDEAVTSDAIQLSSGDFNLSETTLMVGLGANLIAIIDRVEVSATILNVSSKKQTVIQLLTPEIGAVKGWYKARTKGTKIKGLTVQAITVANQKMYLMLSGFKVEEEAPVLVVDISGKVNKTYRVPMKNGVRHDAPESILVNGSKLFVLDDFGKISTYQL